MIREMWIDKQGLGSKHFPSAKVKSGALVADKIGLPVLRERCKHFGAWLSTLEGLPAAQVTEIEDMLV